MDVASEAGSADVVHWFGFGWMPGAFGFCPSEAAWDAALKEIGDEHTPYPTGCRGSCWTFHKTRRRGWCAIVTVDDDAMDGSEYGGIYNTIAHEAVHVWRSALESVGQDAHVGDEIEAYGIGYIAGCLMDAYEKTRDHARPPEPAA